MPPSALPEPASPTPGAAVSQRRLLPAAASSVRPRAQHPKPGRRCFDLPSGVPRRRAPGRAARSPLSPGAVVFQRRPLPAVPARPSESGAPLSNSPHACRASWCHCRCAVQRPCRCPAPLSASLLSGTAIRVRGHPSDSVINISTWGFSMNSISLPKFPSGGPSHESKGWKAAPPYNCCHTWCLQDYNGTRLQRIKGHHDANRTL